MVCAAVAPESIADAVAARLTVGQLLRRYGLPSQAPPSSPEHADHLDHIRRSLREFSLCRTRPLGGQAWQCPRCERLHFQFHACRNRNCPGCGEPQRDQWLRRMRDAALPIDYAHVVFTVPHELNDLFRLNARSLYGRLMSSAWQTIDRHARDVHDVKLGGVLTLHTWGQRMTSHFHVHSIVTLEGLSLDGCQWRGDLPGDELLGIASLADRYRDRFLDAVARCYADGELTVPDSLMSPEQLLALLARLRRRRWVVNVQLPPPECPGPDAALAYLARYVQGAAISNERLKSHDQGVVAFQIKDYRRGGRKTVERISGQEFVRRLALHVVPKRFVRVRHCGLFANAYAAKNLAVARMFLAAAPPQLDPPITPLADQLQELALRPPVCRQCEDVDMQWLGELHPQVEWARKRFGFYAHRVPGAGFGGLRRPADAARNGAAPATANARPP